MFRVFCCICIFVNFFHFARLWKLRELLFPERSAKMIDSSEKLSRIRMLLKGAVNWCLPWNKWNWDRNATFCNSPIDTRTFYHIFSIRWHLSSTIRLSWVDQLHFLVRKKKSIYVSLRNFDSANNAPKEYWHKLETEIKLCISLEKRTYITICVNLRTFKH